MRSSDLFKALALAALGMTAGTTSMAACFVCDEVVELDQVRAMCFLADYDRYEAAIRASEAGRAEVDLSECAKALTSGTRGIASMPEFPGTGKDGGHVAVQAGLRSVYILDAEGAACLKRLLESRKGPIDPSIRLDLVSACQ